MPEGPSVTAVLDGWARPVLPEGPSVEDMLDGLAWPIVLKGSSVAAALVGWAWSVVPRISVVPELSAFLSVLVPEVLSVTAALDASP